MAARLCGTEVEVRGASPGELSQWLWDFDARPITEVMPELLATTERTGRVGFSKSKLYKTDAFLEAQPFGTVPAAFSPDGRTGIFESNSIMRTVARLGQDRFPLYGGDAYEASRIDGFLDASLVFARDAQIYLLALRDGSISTELHARAQESFQSYLSGTEQALTPRRKFLVGNDVTLADICYVAELCLFHNEHARRTTLDAVGLQPVLRGDSPAPIRCPASIFMIFSCIRPLCRMSRVTWKRSRHRFDYSLAALTKTTTRRHRERCAYRTPLHDQGRTGTGQGG
jgi:glutathione S-transferase